MGRIIFVYAPSGEKLGQRICKAAEVDAVVQRIGLTLDPGGFVRVHDYDAVRETYSSASWRVTYGVKIGAR